MSRFLENVPQVDCLYPSPFILRFSRLVAHPGDRGFWWPALVRDVRHSVASCLVCAQSKSSNSPPAGLIRHLPISSRNLSHIALDCVPGLHPSAWNSVILTVVDGFSKAVHLIPLPMLPAAKEMALVVFDQGSTLPVQEMGRCFHNAHGPWPHSHWLCDGLTSLSRTHYYPHGHWSLLQGRQADTTS